MTNIRQSVERLEYDKEYRWLPCSKCGEKTPAERYIVGDEMCIGCAQKQELTHNEIVREEYQERAKVVEEQRGFTDSDIADELM